jgi:hypothetical protein
MDKTATEPRELSESEVETCRALGPLGVMMALGKLLGPVSEDTPWAKWAKEQEKLPNVMHGGTPVPNVLPNHAGTQYKDEPDFRFLHYARYLLARGLTSRHYPRPLGLEDVVRAYIREHGVPE